MRRLWAVLLMALLLPSFGFEWQGRLSHITRDFDSSDATRRRDLLRMLTGYGAEEVRTLVMHALEDSDASVRQEAAAVAGRVHLRAAAPTLIDWLDDPDVTTRISAVRALGLIADPASTPQLVRALGDADADVRRAAVAALGAIGTRDVVVPLLGRLDDLAPEVRADTCGVLASIHDSRAVVPLIGRAHDNAPEVRTAVFRALGELSDRRALAPLIQALRDDADEARLAAVSALGALRDENAVDALIDLLATRDVRVKPSAVSALGLIGSPRAMRAIVGQLEAGENVQIVIAVLVSIAERAHNEAERAAIITEINGGLDRAGPAETRLFAQALETLSATTSIRESVPLLLRKLADRRGDLTQIERTLAVSGDERALLPLLERLRESSPASLRGTVRALSLYFERQAPDGRAADPLLEALSRVAREARGEVVALLGRVGARRAIPAIRPFLDAEDRATRLAAVTALGDIGDAEGANLLLPLLQDRDPEIRTRAADAVGAAASPDVLRGLLQRFVGDAPIDRGAMAHAIGIALRHLRERESLPGELRDQARNALVRATQASDTQLVAVAVDALALANDPAFVATLVELLAQGSRRVREGAARGLGRFDDNSARVALRTALGDQDIDVAATAAAALGNYGEASDVDALGRLVATLNWPVSANASFALARLARRGLIPAANVARICELLRARDPYTRGNLLVALGSMHATACPDGGASVTSWLDTSHSPIVRVAAARWLNELIEADPEHADPYKDALAACAVDDPEFDAAQACRISRTPPADDVVDVIAYRADGRTPLANGLVAVHFADATNLIVRSDDNAHIRVWNAAHGAIRLDDPLSTRLEVR